jgi:hypothetical protein
MSIVMKNIRTIYFTVMMLLMLSNYSMAQDLLTVKNILKIKNNVSLYANGSLTGVDGSSGEITNNGTLSLTGDWTNNVSSSFLNGTGDVVFNSAAASQTIEGTATTSFYDLTIDNSGGDVMLAQDIFVDHTLSMTTGDLDLQNSITDLGTTGTISGETETTRIKVGDIINNTGTIRSTCTLDGDESAYNPAHIGVQITNNNNLGDITILRGHQVQTGTGSFSGNTSVARYIELRNASDIMIDFGLDGNNKFAMNYWEEELNGYTESELIQYQWVKESTEEWWTPLTGTIDETNNLSTPDNSPYSSYFDDPNWYTINFNGKFTLGSISNPLPVEWLYFTANWQDETYSAVQLEWETASETNSDYYEIQRSGDDMTTWETINTVEAAGFSNQNIEYTDLDESPPADVDIIYYRLKQVDVDGNYKYSDVDAVLSPDNTIQIISIYPNPADDEISVEIEFTVDTHVYIYVWDKLGKIVMLKQAEVIVGNNEFRLDIRHLASSIYTIQAITENGHHKTEQKFVKQ